MPSCRSAHEQTPQEASGTQSQWQGPATPLRVTVLNVRRKTVVIRVGSYVYSVEKFNAFLPEADAVFHSLAFPR